MATLRLAIVADIHHGRDTVTKKGTTALPLLRKFLAETDGGAFDAVIELGDRISDVDPAMDRALQTDVATAFAASRTPRHHLCGNHDCAMLSLRDNGELLGAPVDSRTTIIGDERIVFWQPDVTLTPARGFRLADGDLRRLDMLLSADDRPTLLFSHVPLSGQAQTGNYYFENNPGHATYAEIDAIRRVIAAAPCPIVAVSGHVHWNTVTTVDGTPHLTLQSLTEAFTTGGPAGCTAVLEIADAKLTWTVSGADPFSVSLPWRSRKVAWMPPVPVFHSGSWGMARPGSAVQHEAVPDQPAARQ